MEESCLILQRYFRLHQIKRATNILKCGKDVILNSSFEEYSKTIQTHSTLSLVYFILTKIARVSNYNMEIILNPHEFLTAFVIYGFEDIIINKNIQMHSGIDYNYLIISLSREIVEKFDMISSNYLNKNMVDKFHNLLLIYKKVFDKWREIDGKETIHSLTLSYYEFKYISDIILNKRELYNIPYIEQCEILYFQDQQKEILDTIKSLDGLDYFKNYSYEEIIMNDRIQSQIRMNMHKAFWENLRIELDLEPRNYTQLLNILRDIRDMFCKFVPNNLDIQREIHDGIDIELLKNMLTHDAFDDQNLYNLAMFIISLVKRFQPDIMNEGMDVWERGMSNELKSGIINYTEFLIVFFKSVFNMIETIIHEYNKNLENENNTDNYDIRK